MLCFKYLYVLLSYMFTCNLMLVLFSHVYLSLFECVYILLLKFYTHNTPYYVTSCEFHHVMSFCAMLSQMLLCHVMFHYTILTILMTCTCEKSDQKYKTYRYTRMYLAPLPPRPTLPLAPLPPILAIFRRDAYHAIICSKSLFQLLTPLDYLAFPLSGQAFRGLDSLGSDQWEREALDQG